LGAELHKSSRLPFPRQKLSRPWAALDGSNYEKLFDDFTSVVMNLRSTIQGVGCSMLLEIKESPKSEDKG
jgi:hypothetical protein